LMNQVAALEAKISQLEKDNENLHDEIRRLRGRVADTK
jgi:cell division protein FtsB